MLKRRLADAMVATLNACAQVPGRRFYRYYLDNLNRRFNDFGETTEAEIGKRHIRFACPNLLTRWRVETLASKEPATLDWINGFSREETLWDIGANIGIYSIYAAVARDCRVVAFEPSPVNFAVLERNIVLNDLSEKIAAFPVALGESQRIDHLNMANMEAGGAFASFGGRDPKGAVRIACLGYFLDGFINNFAPPFPQHLKVDVDGNEEAILHGAGRTLADCRLQSVSIELDDRRPEQIARVERTFKQLGFRRTGMFRSPMFPDSPAQNVQFVRA